MRYLRYFLGLLGVSLLVVSCTEDSRKSISKNANKFSDTTIVRIYELADKRDAAGVAAFLNHAEAKYRAEAALQFASIMNTDYADELEALLNDSTDAVRLNVAYALGQTCSLSSTRALIKRYATENASEVRCAMLEAIGKIRGKAFRDEVKMETDEAVNFLDELELNDEQERIGWAKALFWINLSRMQNSGLMQRAPYLLQYATGESKLHFAHAMMRYTSVWSEEWKNYLKGWLQSERDPEVKMAQMGMIAKVDKADAENLLIAHASSDGFDDRVRISAIRSYGRIPNGDLSKLIPLLSTNNETMVMEILTIFSGAENPPDTDTYASNVKSESAAVNAMMSKLTYSKPEDADAMWNAYTTCSNTYDKVHYAHAMGIAPAKHQEVYDAMLSEKEYAVKYALAEAYVEMHTQETLDENVNFTTRAMQAISQHDMGVTALFAATLREENIEADVKAALNVILKEELNRLSLPTEIETYNEIVRTIQAFGDQEIQEKKVDYNHPIDWGHVGTISPTQQVKVTTTKGEFIIQLNVEEAPGTVSSMVKLIGQKFFDGKYFHRVIPNFVAQGGCPRGDGMGSTDYTIRSEFALHDYKTGAVGMASSGTDTEGCQWFVTHCPTPHLEGRYTIFGYVTKGMDVVNQLVIGDKIEKMELI